VICLGIVWLVVFAKQIITDYVSSPRGSDVNRTFSQDQDTGFPLK